MENPKFSKKSILSLSVKGIYNKDGMIELEDGETVDLLALASMFSNMEVKITIKATEEDDINEY